MRDGDRIDHMLSFTRRCLEILDGVDQAQFLSSVDKQESLELNFLYLGEAAARVSEEVKCAHEEIPWHKMTGLRNMLAHEYFNIIVQRGNRSLTRFGRAIALCSDAFAAPVKARYAANTPYPADLRNSTGELQ